MVQRIMTSTRRLFVLTIASACKAAQWYDHPHSFYAPELGNQICFVAHGRTTVEGAKQQCLAATCPGGCVGISVQGNVSLVYGWAKTLVTIGGFRPDPLMNSYLLNKPPPLLAFDQNSRLEEGAAQRAGQTSSLPLCEVGQVSGAEDGGWWHVQRGSSSHSSEAGYRYSPVRCRLARPTAHAARRCLQHRHVHFLGDSVSRYLYLVFAFFLAHGSWPEDFDFDPKHPTASKPSICYERTHLVAGESDWNQFLNGSHSMLTPHEVCDCFRAKSCCCDGRAGEIAGGENRLLRVHGVSLSYGSQMCRPDWRPHGWAPLSNFNVMRNGLRCAAGDQRCFQKTAVTWQYSIPEYVRTALPLLGVSDLVANIGGHQWSTHTHGSGMMREIFRLANAAVSGVANRSGNGVWWRTTSVMHQGGAASFFGKALYHPEVESMASDSGARIFDARAITSRLFSSLPETLRAGTHFDATHLSCSVNRELIILLLNMLCDPAELNHPDPPAPPSPPPPPSPPSPPSQGSPPPSPPFRRPHSTTGDQTGKHVDRLGWLSSLKTKLG